VDLGAGRARQGWGASGEVGERGAGARTGGVAEGRTNRGELGDGRIEVDCQGEW